MALFRFGKSSAESSPRTEEEPGAAKPSVFDRLRAGLSKTAQVLNTDVRDLLKQEGRHVDAAFLEELRGALVRTDMGPSAAEAIVKDVEERLRSRVVDPEVVVESIRRTLSENLAGTTGDLATSSSGPTVILVTGVNGSGKTTSIAKLTRRFTESGLRVVLGAGDTFRAAAVEQLSMWAGRLGADIVRGDPGSDPASIAHRAVAQAVEGSFDI
ncbi:MAG: signal recognition particle receptor subunit alpha, partial [Pirellulales bacterium]|nr:signal recognition particle receptor subunit alpha [Pirellulales bacterium]